MSFKEAINTAIRSWLNRKRKQRKGFRQKSYNIGIPSVPLRKALQLSAEIEDQAIIRDLTIRK